MRKFSAQAKQEAKENLLRWIKPGDEVFCILRKVAKSGMQRTIQLVTFSKRDDGKIDPIFIGYNVATLLEMSYDREEEGIKVRGAGMDMGFAIVYDLGLALFPGEKGHGGEVLKHRWL